MRTPTAADRVRERLKEELQAREISQRDVADALTTTLAPGLWTQSKVQKVLSGAVELKVDDAEAIAKVAGIFLTEAVRDRGLEFYAEMTPTELRILEQLRKRPHVLHGVMSILEMLPRPPESSAPVRKRAKRGRPLNRDASK